MNQAVPLFPFVKSRRLAAWLLSSDSLCDPAALSALLCDPHAPLLLLLCLSALVEPQQGEQIKQVRGSARLFDCNVIPKLSA